VRRLATLVLACIAACGGGEEPVPPREAAPSAARPNVVVVMIDTLRPDHLECFGHSAKNSPFLSQLARNGVAFSRAWSSSTWTAPATASLFTSLYPTQHGVLEGFFIHRTRTAEATDATVSVNRLPEAARTLPEHFREAGWRTWGIACNVNVTPRLGFDRGFETFHDYTGPEYGKGASAEHVFHKLREWKSALASAPYFLYLHFNDVHSPWRDHPASSASQLEGHARSRANYDGEIEYVDAVVGELFRELGWSRNTLLCVVSDHGEEFGEHGSTGHGFSVYRELMQIVWLLHWPEGLRTRRVIEENVGLVDVFPTLAELAGAPYASGLEGRSLANLVRGGPAEAPRAFFAHRVESRESKELWAVVKGPWKLVVREEAVELYDASRDPTEKLDLARERPEVAEELRRELETFRARAKRLSSEAVDVELDRAQAEALEKLGYTDGKR
jgi:arylsulfatase A-like enzyme